MIEGEGLGGHPARLLTIVPKGCSALIGVFFALQEATSGSRRARTYAVPIALHNVIKLFVITSRFRCNLDILSDRVAFLPFNYNVWQGVDARHRHRRDSRFGSPAIPTTLLNRSARNAQ